MKIILVFPRIVSDYGLPRTPPLGIAYLGAALKKAGHRVRAVDLRLHSQQGNYLEKLMRSFKPDLLGVSATSFGYLKGKEVLTLAKRLSPQTLTILGGPHAAIAGKLVIKDPNLDLVAVGEGEELMVELLAALEKKKNLKSVRGLLFKDRQGKIVAAPSRELMREIDCLPLPDLDLFPLAQYGAGGTLTLPLMTSRGCPYNCIYCVSHKTQGRIFRGRNYQKVVDEIERDVKKYQATHFTILDDNFTLDPQRAINICREIIKRGLKISWQCDQGIRADRVNFEVFQTMRASGCKLVALGVENPDPGVLRQMRKGETIATIKKAILAAQKTGLIVKAFFIVGAPGDNFRLVKKSIKFFKDLDIDLPRYSMMTVYPGSDLWGWVEKNGRFLGNPYDYVIKNADTTKEAQFETADFPAAARIAAYQLASDEAEKWIIRYKLKSKLGKLGLGIFPFLASNPGRFLIRKLYQLKLIKVVD